jgi:primosomal protein N' (replication factor Y)
VSSDFDVQGKNVGEVLLDIIVNVPALWDTKFTYTCPWLLPRGTKVKVPFGQRTVDGFVVSEQKSDPGIALKEVKSIYDLTLVPNQRLLDFGQELANYYCAPVSSVWNHLWPSSIRSKSVRRMTEVNPIIWSPCTENNHSKNKRPILLMAPARDRWTTYREHVLETLSLGQRVLILVPERRSYKHVISGLDLSSDVSLVTLDTTFPTKERNRDLRLAVSGKADVVIGSQSAALADIPNLGLIIVDEEESDSFKSLDYPFMDARTVALLRGEYFGVKIIMGSSHPRVTTFYSGRQSTFDIQVKLTSEIDKRQILIIDERKMRRDEVVSSLLGGLVRTYLTKGKNIVIIVGRKGHARYVQCEDCDTVIECPRCKVSMSYYATDRTMMCPICGTSQEAPVVCPSCASTRWRFSGFGIDAYAREIRSLAPTSKVYRIDSDTPPDKAIETINHFCESKEGACLLATQAILGYGHLKDVGLTCVVSFDSLLMAPDYRARERGFHLLARLREMTLPEDGTGIFAVQTRNETHPVFRALTEPVEFYSNELIQREMLRYPPFGEFFRITITSSNSAKAESMALKFTEEIAKEDEIDVLGPVVQERGKSGWEIALKSCNGELLRRVTTQAIKHISQSGVRVLVDVEPAKAT